MGRWREQIPTICPLVSTFVPWYVQCTGEYMSVYSSIYTQKETNVMTVLSNPGSEFRSSGLLTSTFSSLAIFVRPMIWECHFKLLLLLIFKEKIIYLVVECIPIIRALRREDKRIKNARPAWAAEDPMWVGYGEPILI